jgi:O-antigen/teichoic acid export membrane protein
MTRAISMALGLRVAGTLGWLAFGVLLARTLPVAEAGLVFFVTGVVLVLGPLAAAGYDLAVLRFASVGLGHGETGAVRALRGEATVVCLAVSGLVAVGLLTGWALGGVSPVTGRLDLVVLTALSVAATGLMAIQRDLLRAAGRLGPALVGQSLYRTLLPLAACAGLAAAGLLTAEAALGCCLGALGAAIVQQSVALRGLGLSPLRPRRLAHARVALAVWPGDAALLVLQRGAGIALGLTAGLEAAALYLVAERVAQPALFLTDAVRTVLAPDLARAAIPADRHRALRRASLLFAATGACGILAVIALGGLVIGLHGPPYGAALPVLLILLVGQASWAVFGPCALVLNLHGEEAARSRIAVLCALGFGLALTVCTNPVEAAAAAAVACWLMNAALWVCLRRRLGLVAGLPALLPPGSLRARAVAQAPRPAGGA